MKIGVQVGQVVHGDDLQRWLEQLEHFRVP